MWTSFDCNHTQIRIINTEIPECVEEAKNDNRAAGIKGVDGGAAYLPTHNPR